MIFDMLPESPIIPYCAALGTVIMINKNITIKSCQEFAQVERRLLLFVVGQSPKEFLAGCMMLSLSTPLALASAIYDPYQRGVLMGHVIVLFFSKGTNWATKLNSP